MFGEILKLLRALFLPVPPTPRKARTEPLPPGSWCLVGNVGGSREHPPADAASRGTKHFSFGTKLYCLPPQWGDGYERLIAIGQRRGSHRLIEIVMHSDRVTNWRAQQVFEPKVLLKLGQALDGFARQWRDEANVRAVVDWLVSREAERRNATVTTVDSPRS